LLRTGTTYIFALFKINLNNIMALIPKNVSQMKPGDIGIISGFTDEYLSVKLMEMGCLPGIPVRFNFTAPFGDPVCISVSGYELSLRLEEAATISIVN
jgi:ferrous iron transport protein A